MRQAYSVERRRCWRLEPVPGACLTNGRRHEGATHASREWPWIATPGLRGAGTAQRNDPHRADFCDRFASIVGTMGVKRSQKDADVGRPQPQAGRRIISQTGSYVPRMMALISRL